MGWCLWNQWGFHRPEKVQEHFPGLGREHYTNSAILSQSPCPVGALFGSSDVLKSLLLLRPHSPQKRETRSASQPCPPSAPDCLLVVSDELRFCLWKFMPESFLILQDATRFFLISHCYFSGIYPHFLGVPLFFCFQHCLSLHLWLYRAFENHALPVYTGSRMKWQSFVWQLPLIVVAFLKMIYIEKHYIMKKWSFFVMW